MNNLLSAFYHCLVCSQYKDWGAVMDLYRHASASLNGRLHSGVLSLAAGRPSIFLASNKKYGDLLGSINMRDLLFHPHKYVFTA
jgi:polysaccharide pyruvyl transferase WcaK-like protein